MENVKYIEEPPTKEIESDEFYELVLNFCTFICLLKNKKMNFPSIFVEIIKDRDILTLYTEFCGFSDERDAVREFMEIDDSIIRSKYLKKFINQNNGIE